MKRLVMQPFSRNWLGPRWGGWWLAGLIAGTSALAYATHEPLVMQTTVEVIRADLYTNDDQKGPVFLKRVNLPHTWAQDVQVSELFEQAIAQSQPLTLIYRAVYQGADTLDTALLLRTSGQVSVLNNGVVVRTHDADPTMALTRDSRPKWVSLGKSVLAADNSIDVVLTAAHLRQAGLSRIVLTNAWNAQRLTTLHWARNVAPLVMVLGICVVGALFMGFAWRIGRNPTVLCALWACIAWVGYLTASTPIVQDAIGRYSDVLYALSVLACTVAGCALVLRYGGAWSLIWRRALALHALAVCAVVVFCVAADSWWSYRFVPLCHWLVALAAIATLLYGYAKTRVAAKLTGAVGASIWVVLAARDYVLMNFSASGLEVTELAPYTFPSYMLIVVWTLAQRALQSARAMERHNAELEHKLAQREAELAQHFEKARDQERSATLQHERQRIAKEMHDGLGHQLVATLSMLRPEHSTHQRIAQSIQQCLLEMRMTVDGMHEHCEDLAMALGPVRHRLLPAFEAAGIELGWEVDEVDAQTLEPERVHLLMRFVQEALSNVLQHSGATRCDLRVMCVPEDQRLVLVVDDNGLGLQRGHGGGEPPRLRSLNARAAALNAALFVSARNPSGLRVQLVCPLASMLPRAPTPVQHPPELDLHGWTLTNPGPFAAPVKLQ
jgi:signal transduction histidine kinase